MTAVALVDVLAEMDKRHRVSYDEVAAALPRECSESPEKLLEWAELHVTLYLARKYSAERATAERRIVQRTSTPTHSNAKSGNDSAS